MSVVAILLLSPLALAFAVLALPIHGRVRGGVSEGEPTFAVRIAWAFGLVSAEMERSGSFLRVAGLAVFRLRPWPGRPAGAHPENGHRAAREGSARAAARFRSGARKTTTLLRMGARLVRTFHLRLWLRGRVGTGDPAATAALAALTRAAGALPGVGLEVEVDWLEEVLEVEGEGSARVWAPELLAVAGLLLARRENRAAVRALMR